VTGVVQMPEDYSDLGMLLIVQLLLTLILPFLAIAFARLTRFKSA
jgi:Tfp pilus assembly protein PilX